MIAFLSITLIINTVLMVILNRQNSKLNKKLVDQVNLTIDALDQSKAHLANNIELLRIIEHSSTKEEMIRKYFLNKSLDQ